MRISILMPVYNAADTVNEAIESMLHQSRPDFEYLIVDDGSADNTSEIIKERARQDDRIRPFFNKHEGIVSALNYGLEQANGKYIARMDADDISHPRRLEKQCSFLEEHVNIGLVSCLVHHLGDKENKAGYARYVAWINSLVRHEDISINRFIESPLSHPSVMFRKELIDRFGGYRQGRIPEDYELWLRWLEQDVRMHKIPEVLLQWRDESTRLSRTHPRYSVDAFYATKAVYLARWLSRHNPYHPDIVVWGAGRTSRKRADLLANYGINITHYIDIDPNKIGRVIHRRPVWSTEEIPEAGSHFIVSYVGRYGANNLIREHLMLFGYRLGTDHIFAA